MKKLLIVLALVVGAVLVLFLNFGGDDHKGLTRETQLTGQDASKAEKFAVYIHDYAKKNGLSEFQKRFRYIPPEAVKHVWETLKSIPKMPEAAKVTVPATGATRRCVYYPKGPDKFYKFVVNNAKDKWLFQELAVVGNE